MGCRASGRSLLNELKDLVDQVGSCDADESPCCTEPCCTPCTFPYAQVIMTCPPPILAPTVPQPVKPLQIRCPESPDEPIMTQEERESSRYDNFYNNYNINWHSESPRFRTNTPPWCTPDKQRGQTLDGKSPCCDEPIKSDSCDPEGCPTGFKKCTMKLTPPPGCHPYGVWCAEVQPCPPKPRRYAQHQPGDCYVKGCSKK